MPVYHIKISFDGKSWEHQPNVQVVKFAAGFHFWNFPAPAHFGDAAAVVVNLKTAKHPMLTREQALAILHEFTKSESLRKHALAVESCVAAYAKKFGEDENKWSLTALLHDFDYEMHPNAPDHPMKGEPILAERGIPEDVRRAILSHANYSGVPRQSALEKTLFACDELAGFITAVSLVKPRPQRP